MKYVKFNDDGSVLFERKFFEGLTEKNDMLDFTVTIERRGEQINFLNPKIKRPQ